MIEHSGHLSDDALIRVVLAHPVAGPEWQHLKRCPACEDRRARLSLLLDEVHEVAAAEADVVFNDDRLDTQRARILQRVDQTARRGCVVRFPVSAGGYVSPVRNRRSTRWIAAAAAAGLAIGVFAGYRAHHVPIRTAAPASRVAVDVGTALPVEPLPVSSDEEFLDRVEIAIEGTSGSALEPLDDLTPRVWEVAAH